MSAQRYKHLTKVNLKGSASKNVIDVIPNDINAIAAILNSHADALDDGLSGYTWFKATHSTLPEDEASGWVNIAIGTGCFSANIDGGANISIGSNSLVNLITTGGGEWAGSENISLGRGNGTGITDGSQNTLIGRAVAGGTAGNFAYSILMGYEAGKNAVGSNLDSHVGIGIYAMLNATLNDNYNTAVGGGAFNGATMNGYNVAFGGSAGFEGVFNQFNTMIGASAMRDALGGSYNTAVGTSAGREMNGDNNTVVGRSAGHQITGSYNSALGAYAGYHATVALTGDNNGFFGRDASHNKAALFGSINIGNWTQAVDDNTILIGGFTDVGRGTAQIVKIKASVVMITDLPTSNPTNAGQLWSNSNVLTISAG